MEELKSRPCWALVIRGPPERVPGFVHVGSVQEEDLSSSRVSLRLPKTLSRDFC